MHHARVRRYQGPGPVGMVGRRADIAVRFVNGVQVDGPVMVPELGPCHTWTGYVHASGFGALRRGNRMIYVHRLAWTLVYGEIPVKGRVVQKCGNRLCVRPDHLELKLRCSDRSCAT